MGRWSNGSQNVFTGQDVRLELRMKRLIAIDALAPAGFVNFSTDVPGPVFFHHGVHACNFLGMCRSTF